MLSIPFGLDQQTQMVATGILFAFLSGVCNGVFTTPMKLIPRWKWENIWLVFILTGCLALPAALVLPAVPDVRQVFAGSPPEAVAAALGFGFAWGFGAILFGLAVHLLGISVANSMVIGISSALGSLVPLVLKGALRLDFRQMLLFGGVAVFLVGIWLCGSAGRMRDTASSRTGQALAAGYVFAIASGVLSAIFNIGYSLALPIAAAGERLGLSGFNSTNCIWLLMLGAGSLPNIGYCLYLFRKNATAGLLGDRQPLRTWGGAVLMGLLWGGSIFLYGAAAPRLGDIGPSIGWPLSLSVALLVANSMGVLLGEWRGAAAAAQSRMKAGIAFLVLATILCAASSGAGA